MHASMLSTGTLFKNKSKELYQKLKCQSEEKCFASLMNNEIQKALNEDDFIELCCRDFPRIGAKILGESRQGLNYLFESNAKRVVLLHPDAKEIPECQSDTIILRKVDVRLVSAYWRGNKNQLINHQIDLDDPRPSFLFFGMTVFDRPITSTLPFPSQDPPVELTYEKNFIWVREFQNYCKHPIFPIDRIQQAFESLSAYQLYALGKDIYYFRMCIMHHDPFRNKLSYNEKALVEMKTDNPEENERLQKASSGEYLFDLCRGTPIGNDFHLVIEARKNNEKETLIPKSKYPIIDKWMRSFDKKQLNELVADGWLRMHGHCNVM